VKFTGFGSLLGLEVYRVWKFTGLGSLLGLGVYWAWEFTGLGGVLVVPAVFEVRTRVSARFKSVC